MATIDLNPDNNLIGALTARESQVSGRDHSWNYKKYAYINAKTTGKCQTAGCPDSYGVGDSNVPTGGALSLYTTEDGARRLKPILKSCKITNEGGQDYTDSYIWEAELSIKVYTKADLNKLATSFFVVGAEIHITFGWNVGGAGNTGEVFVNTYNFSWTLESDGGFLCTVKGLSSVALWQGETMTTNNKTSKYKKELGEENKKPGFFDELKGGFRKAFDIAADGEIDDANNNPWIPDFLEAAFSSDELSDNKLLVKEGYVSTLGKKCPFWVTEMLSSEGTWYNDDEMYFTYTNFDTVISFINKVLEKQGSPIKYEFLFNKQSSWHRKEFFSADPTRVVMPGLNAQYGIDLSVEDERNFAAWAVESLKYQTVPRQHLGSILLELGYLENTYATLASENPTTKAGGQQPPSIQKFLKKICKDIQELTGAFLQPQIIPSDDFRNPEKSKGNSGGSDIFVIINRPMAVKTKSPKGYTFKTLDTTAIHRNISFETDFDAESLLLATESQMKAGNSTFSSKAPGICAGKSAADLGDPIKAEELEELKGSYGKNGFSQATVTTATSLMSKYRAQQSDNLGKGYKEIIWPFKLSVTLDGIAGMKYLAPITIDRLPDSFTESNAYFSITSIEHTFDGQGDWETSFNTVMRIP
jgi:hypothetical protein